MDKVVFCSATAGDRFDQALCLFKSIRRIYPKAECRFDALECSKKQLKKLKKEKVIVEAFSWDNLPNMFGDNIEDLKYLVEKHKEEKGYIAYTENSLVCAAWRLFMIPRLMKKLNSPLMWFDSDCLLRGRIDSFIKKSLNYDFSVHFRPKNKDVSKILSSVFLVNNTEKGKLFCDYLEPFYRNIFKEVAWWADPYSLYLALEKSKVNFWNFPAKTYNDSSFHSKSKIWHAKHGGIKNPKWKKEVKKYLK